MSARMDYLGAADHVGRWIDRMKGPPYTWSVPARLVYVLTWPFSSLARGVAFVVLGLVWLIVGGIGFILNRLTCVWHGERSLWGD